MKIRIICYKIREKIFCLRFKKLKECNLPYRYFDEKSRSEKWVFYQNNRFNYYHNLENALNDIGRYDLTYHVQTKVEYYPKTIKKIDIIHFHEFDSVIHALYKNPESFNIPDEYLYEYSEQQLNYLKTIKSFFKIIGLKDTDSSKEVKKLENEYIKLEKEKPTILKKIKLHVLWYKLQNLNRKDKLERCINSRAKEFENYRTIWKNKEKIEDILNEKSISIIYKYPNKNKNQRYLLLKENEFVGIAEANNETKIKFKDLTQKMVDKGKYKSFKEYKKTLLKDFQEYDQLFTEDSYIYIYKIKLIEKF